MDADACLLRGDDSSWNMSDWQWDSKAFRAKPVVEPPLQSACCKKRKTEDQTRMTSAACGGCRAGQSTIAFALAPDTRLLSVESNCGATPAAMLVNPDRPSKDALKGKQAGREGAEHARSHECTCQADGCSSNLLQQSVWHQKSRICDQHMSSVFLKQGKAQQFCQQCGRSHNPDAFDKGRRSCRTQLAKHAARRRKRNVMGSSKDPNSAQPDPAPERAPPANPIATGCRAAASLAAFAQQGGNSEAFFQNLCSTVKTSSSTASLSQALDSEHRHTSGASDQSLVSQPNFRQQLQLAAEPAMAAYHQGSVDAVKPYDAAVDFMLEDKAFLQLPVMTQANPQTPEPLIDDPLQDVLNWQLPETGESQPHLSSLDQALAFMQDGSEGSQTSFQQQLPSLSSAPAFSLEEPAPGIPAGSAAATHPSTLPAPSPAPHQVSHLPSMGLDASQEAYPSNFAAMRLSVKLFNCTPAQLPDNLRQQLTGWLNCIPAGAEGYIRPGCVHLTMSATVPSQGPDAQPTVAHLRQAVGHLLATPEQDIWHRSTMLVQLGSQAAVVHQGNAIKVWSLTAQHDNAAAAAGSSQGCNQATACAGLPAALPSKLPQLQCPEPVCLIAGHRQRQSIRLEAQSWSQDCKMVCRAGGKHWEVHVLPPKSQQGGCADCHGQTLEVLLPCNLPMGLLFLEAQRGSFMGSELPILVAPTAAMAQESLRLFHSTFQQDRVGLTTDLGFILGNSNEAPLLLARAACQLLVRAVQQGLPNLTWLLMDAVMRDDAGLLGKVRGPASMGLLHLAVKSGSCAVLAALLQPAAAASWQAAWRGPAGLTPLHLAALLPDGQAIALQLCTAFGAGQWLTAAADDGLTPAQFAVRAGKHTLNRAVASLRSQATESGADRKHLMTGINKQHLRPRVGGAVVETAGPASKRLSMPVSSSSKHHLPQPSSSVSAEHADTVLDQPAAAVCGQKRACPSASAQVMQKQLKPSLLQTEWMLHKVPKCEASPCCSSDNWASSSCSETSSSSGSSSGEEDCCISEPHVFSQLSQVPDQGPAPGQELLTGFVQQQKQRLAALCRMHRWHAAGVHC